MIVRRKQCKLQQELNRIAAEALSDTYVRNQTTVCTKDHWAPQPESRDIKCSGPVAHLDWPSPTRLELIPCHLRNQALSPKVCGLGGRRENNGCCDWYSYAEAPPGLTIVSVGGFGGFANEGARETPWWRRSGEHQIRARQIYLYARVTFLELGSYPGGDLGSGTG